MLAATQPYYKTEYRLPAEKCRGSSIKAHELDPLDKIYVDELTEAIQVNDYVLFLQHNYTPFQSERVYKNTLTKLGGIFRSHKNEIYKEVFVRLEVDRIIQQLFVTRNSLVVGKIESLAPCVKALRRMPQFILLAGCIDRELYNYSQLQSISANPNIDLCRANLLATLETPAIDLAYYLEQYVDMHETENDKPQEATDQSAISSSQSDIAITSKETSEIDGSEPPTTSQ